MKTLLLKFDDNTFSKLKELKGKMPWEKFIVKMLLKDEYNIDRINDIFQELKAIPGMEELAEMLRVLVIRAYRDQNFRQILIDSLKAFL